MDRTKAIDILHVIAPPRTSKKAFYDFMKARDMAIAALEQVSPSKYGKWIWNGDTLDWERLHYCSECKKYALRDTDGKYEVLSDFCPSCGADMREK